MVGVWRGGKNPPFTPVLRREYSLQGIHLAKGPPLSKWKNPSTHCSQNWPWYSVGHWHLSIHLAGSPDEGSLEAEFNLTLSKKPAPSVTYEPLIRMEVMLDKTFMKSIEVIPLGVQLNSSFSWSLKIYSCIWYEGRLLFWLVMLREIRVALAPSPIMTMSSWVATGPWSRIFRLKVKFWL